MSQMGQKLGARLSTAPVDFRLPPYHLDMHMHSEGQLVYVHRGKMALMFRDAGWAVFGPSLVWIPANCPHSGSSITAFTGATFWEAELPRLRFPSTPCRLAIPPKLNLSCFLTGSRGKVRSIIGNLLYAGQRTNFALAFPRLPAMRYLAIVMMVTPNLIMDVDVAADHIGMSRRSFTRRFRIETELSFAQWRRALVTYCADVLFRDKESVSSIAHQLGYDSVSAFIAMYRRTRGRTLAAKELVG
jgi:AraC-like DNA-binding protein